MGFFFCISLLFLRTWQAPQRSLDPALFDTQAQLEKPTIAELRNDQSIVFHVPISPPLELERRPIQLNELNAVQLHDSEALHEILQKQPWLLPKSILVEGLFSGSLRNCSVAAIWGNGTLEVAAPAKCTKSGLEIRPPKSHFGVFELKLSLKCAGYDCKWQLPYSPAPGKNWLHVKSTNENSLFALLTIAFQEQGVLAALAVLGMLIVALTLLNFFGTHKPFILVVGVLFIHFGLAPAYVGYDETAHVTMLERARQAQLRQPIQPPAADFNSSLVSHMVESAFFRLHNVSIPPTGACAHEVVGGCGESEQPLRYYSALLTLLPNSVIKKISPEYLWLAGRHLNLIPILVFTLSIFFIFTASTQTIIFIISSLLGSFWSQVGTTTNDVPQYLYAFLIVASWLEMLQGSSKKRKIASVVICFLYFPIAYSIDVSALAAIPALVGLGLTTISCLVFSSEPCTEPTLPQQSASIIKSSIYVAIPVVIMAWLIPHFIGMLTHTPIWQSLASQEPHLARISGMASVTAAEVPRIVGGYLSNLAGSFVWGHSYLPVPMTFLWVVFITFLSLAGLKTFSWQTGGVRRWLICTGVVIAITGHYLLITSIAGPTIHAEAVAADSFLKPRLTAPGIAGLFILASLGLGKLLQSKKIASLIVKTSAVWNIILFFYLIGFYWGDIF